MAAFQQHILRCRRGFRLFDAVVWQQKTGFSPCVWCCLKRAAEIKVAKSAAKACFTAKWPVDYLFVYFGGKPPCPPGVHGPLWWILDSEDKTGQKVSASCVNLDIPWHVSAPLCPCLRECCRRRGEISQEGTWTYRIAVVSGSVQGAAASWETQADITGSSWTPCRHARPS